MDEGKDDGDDEEDEDDEGGEDGVGVGKDDLQREEGILEKEEEQILVVEVFVREGLHVEERKEKDLCEMIRVVQLVGLWLDFEWEVIVEELTVHHQILVVVSLLLADHHVRITINNNNNK